MISSANYSAVSANRLLQSRSILCRYFVSAFQQLVVLVLVVFAQPSWSTESSSKLLLLRNPTINGDQIAFSYAGYIWTMNREGDHLQRLTEGGHEERPFLSPDGKLIAYTGVYGGTRSIFVIPAKGGDPRRLTYHSADIDAAGWTPDSRNVMFTSSRLGYAPRVDENTQLFTVAATGGFATPVQLKRSSEGSYSPDGAQIAYVPNVQWSADSNGQWRTSVMDTWKHYRGGQTKRIWIARLSDSKVLDRVPRENSNDFNPMWIGNTIYFLSDRNGPVSLFSYDPTSNNVAQVVPSDEWDIKSASACGDAIVYAQMGSLHLLDLKTGKSRLLNVQLNFQATEAQPHLLQLQPQQISEATLSPSGSQVAFGARGEILTVSTRTGAAVDLTRTTDVVERTPAWSPDGGSIAYLSDASGGYQLYIRNADGSGEVRKISLTSPSSYYYALAWSPDSTKIGFTDKELNYWYVDVKDKTPVRIDTDTHVPQRDPPLQFAWSPDSRWMAYVKQLPSHVHAIYLYSLDLKNSFQITDGTSDALHVAFDKSGKYLYFTASTDIFSVSDDWSNIERPIERRVYAMTLQKGNPAKSGSGIDIHGIERRMTALAVPPANYVNLYAADAGTLLLTQAPKTASATSVVDFDDPSLKLIRFDTVSQKLDTLVDAAEEFDFSADGSQVLFSTQSHWFLSRTVPTSKSTSAPNNKIDIRLDSLQVNVDPRAEWRHMFEQILRNERAFFYDPGLHGLDLAALRERYEPFLESLSSREELNYLLEDMLGEMTCGHMFLSSGRYPEPVATKTGLLGADYLIKNNRYQISRIYEGDTWDPSSEAPLASPELNVKPGEYVLAINGREIKPPADLFSYFEGTAGKKITLKIGPRPDGSLSHDIVVVPIDDETRLRNRAWVEANRRRVSELSGGRVAYVYLSDVLSAGYEQFNRYYFAQADKDAVIIDDRFNHGGSAAEYIVDYLRRPLMGYWHLRDRGDLTIPLEGIFGPKVMLINEMAGSGGDMLAWFFRRLGIGPLVGERTWGGLVSTAVGPDDLLDGTVVSTPNEAFYNPEGAWDVENHGVSPDIEIRDSAKAGEDPQLDKAVEAALSLLKGTRTERPPGPPPFPNYHQTDSLGSIPSSPGDATANRQN